MTFEGWIGFSEGKPYFEHSHDTYCDLGESIEDCLIFKRERDARKRFQDYRRVRVTVIDKQGEKGR